MNDTKAGYRLDLAHGTDKFSHFEQVIFITSLG